jgi:hypothetical protein
MMAAHTMLPYKEIGNNMFAAKQAFYPLTNFGNSAYFTSGSGAYLSITSATNLITWATSTGFTIEYWITGWSNADEFNGPGNHNITGTNYWAFGPAGNNLSFPYYLNNIITINNVVNSAAWNNICLVASPASIPNNTTLRFYVNGELVLTQAATLNAIDVNIPFIIGLSEFGDWRNVYMDNLRVSNVNRYSGSSYTLATEPFTSDASTQLLLTCDGANGSTSITDSSGFARTVTNNGVVISNARQNHS